MFICGVMLVASMALMAPLLQAVMGYPIIDAGMLLGTRGVGMAISMLFAGRLMTLHRYRASYWSSGCSAA